jgi:hypothetical protein
VDWLALQDATPNVAVAILGPMTQSTRLMVAQHFAMSNDWNMVIRLVREYPAICEEQAGLLSMAAVMAWRPSPLRIGFSVFGICSLFVGSWSVSRQYLASISPVSRQYLASILPVSRQYLIISISSVSRQYFTK